MKPAVFLPLGQAKEQFLFSNCIAHAPETSHILNWDRWITTEWQKKSVNLNCEVPLSRADWALECDWPPTWKESHFKSSPEGKHRDQKRERVIMMQYVNHAAVSNAIKPTSIFFFTREFSFILASISSRRGGSACVGVDLPAARQEHLVYHHKNLNGFIFGIFSLGMSNDFKF